jgi:catechol 2,3-dioxygenase-like lactoylglutathione lyase family enzyme
MFDHVEFSVSDIAGARAFYGGICKAIGREEVFFDTEGKELGIGQDDIVSLLLFEGKPTQPRMHICLKAEAKQAVDTAHAAALSAGGTCNGKPGYREDYGPGYYAAFMRDADGHNIEVLFREVL